MDTEGKDGTCPRDCTGVLCYGCAEDACDYGKLACGGPEEDTTFENVLKSELYDGDFRLFGQVTGSSVRKFKRTSHVHYNFFKCSQPLIVAFLTGRIEISDLDWFNLST